MDDVLGYAGRRAVVTGAASGMGQATAQVLADLGVEVVALDIEPTTVPVAQSIEVDLRDRASIDVAVAAVAAGGPIGVVFNCAGLPGPPFRDLDVMLVNFVGPRHLIESLAPSMPTGSAVAWVASAACIGWEQNVPVLMGLIQSEGYDGGRRWCEYHRDKLSPSSYAFSKQVINGYVAARAGRFMERGIRLNCTNPGPTETPMMPFFHESAGRDLVDAAVGPLGRYSTPEEQAWPLVVLNSPRLAAVTGSALYTDGGFYGALTTGQVDFTRLAVPPGGQE